MKLMILKIFNVLKILKKNKRLKEHLKYSIKEKGNTSTNKKAK